MYFTYDKNKVSYDGDIWDFTKNHKDSIKF